MHWQAIFVLLTIVGVIVFLYLEVFRPAYILFAATVAFVTVGIISPKEALEGFSNEQLAVIILLLVVSSILKKSSIIDRSFQLMLSQNDKPKKFLTKMTSGISVLSAIFNNTPLVAMMMPYVFNWSKKNKVSASKFLIPLSYASILGGCITLVGTSTNLLVNGIAIEEASKNNINFNGLEMFDFSIVGLPLMLIGIGFLIFLSKYLLPDNKSNFSDLEDSSRKYFLEAKIEGQNSVVGKSVQEAGLRNLDGLFLVEIKRGDRYLRPVSSQEVIKEDDRLFFSGTKDAIGVLEKLELGLSFPAPSSTHSFDQKSVYEIVISHNSKLAGQLVRDSDFRSRYDGAILAIHRNGEKVWGQLGEITLKAGDVLLVMAGNDFLKRAQNNPSFYILSGEQEEKEVDVKRMALLFIGMLASIVLSALKILPLFTCLMVLITFAMTFRIAKPKEIINNLDYNIILVFAMGLSLGRAMEKSGAKALITDGLLKYTDGFGPIGLMAIMFIVTNLLSSIITTQAAVAIMTPISMSIASGLGVAIEPFVLVIAFAGAANFITPIGYQTNLMVYGPGGYKFKDFFKVGFPLTLIYLVGTVSILSIWFNFI